MASRRLARPFPPRLPGAGRGGASSGPRRPRFQALGKVRASSGQITAASEIAGKKLSGTVVEKKQAERDYEDAITDGNSAVMLQEAGPGLYTASLGNLMAEGFHATGWLIVGVLLRHSVFRRTHSLPIAPTMPTLRLSSRRLTHRRRRFVPRHIGVTVSYGTEEIPKPFCSFAGNGTRRRRRRLWRRSHHTCPPPNASRSITH